MEPHRSLKLVLVVFAISMAGVRSRVVPDVSPTPQPAAARSGSKVPTTSDPKHSPHASSPTPKHAASPLKGDSPPLKGKVDSPPFKGKGDSPPLKGVSLHGIASVLANVPANAPDQSVAAEEAAALAEEIDVPSAKGVIDGIDVSAALKSVDQNTLKSISSYM